MSDSMEDNLLNIEEQCEEKSRMIFEKVVVILTFLVTQIGFVFFVVGMSHDNDKFVGIGTLTMIVTPIIALLILGIKRSIG